MIENNGLVDQGNTQVSPGPENELTVEVEIFSRFNVTSRNL